MSLSSGRFCATLLEYLCPKILGGLAPIPHTHTPIPIGYSPFPLMIPPMCMGAQGLPEFLGKSLTIFGHKPS